MLAVDTLMAAIMGAEGQHSRASGRDVPLKTAVLHKRRCSTSEALPQTDETCRENLTQSHHVCLY